MLQGGYKRGTFVARDVTFFAFFGFDQRSYTVSKSLDLGTRQSSSTDRPLRPSFARNSRVVVRESEVVDRAMT